MPNYSTYIGHRVTLEYASQNPLIVTNTGTLSPAGAYSYAVVATNPLVFWTISNYGSIGPSASHSVGIFLSASGAVTNHASGRIITNPVLGVAVDFHGGGAATNLAGGTIEGQIGVFSTGFPVSVLNAGSIGGLGSTNVGVLLLSGGTITNQGGGHITGYYGADIELGAMVVNAGTISGSMTRIGGSTFQVAGLAFYAGGTLTNQANGLISGFFGFGDSILPTTVTNAGTIAGNSTQGAGIVLQAGGSITNQTSGTVTGAFGILGSQAASAIVNAGTIYGNYEGLYLTQGASVTNSGLIANVATYTGLLSTYGIGVDLSGGGTIVNNTSGIIWGTFDGVEIGASASSTVTGVISNQGKIIVTGSAGAAIRASGSELISNAASGTIMGGTYGGVAYGATTLINRGSIGGTEFAFYEAALGNSSRVIIYPGATFSGTVTGGNLIGATVASTLELASGTSAGTLSGLGSQFIDFAQVTVDAGATWALGSGSTLQSGVTLGGSGTLREAGTLTNNGRLSIPVTLGGGGVLINSSGGTIVGSGQAALRGTSGGAATVVNPG